MTIGFVGLGKLGLPVALAIEDKGYTVVGYDINPKLADIFRTRKLPYQEEGAEKLLKFSSIRLLGNIRQVVDKSDIIFCPVQTPHQARFEGTTPLPAERADFDYSYLVDAVNAVAEAAELQKKHVTLVVISTCLPGTFESRIEPLLNDYVHYVYNPFFIAMGTTIHDFLHPEFVLLGENQEKERINLLSAKDQVSNFYSTIHDRPLFWTDIKTAELTKVAYNTYIGQKITFINAMMEICHKTGANVDDLSDALALATDRVISSKYLRGGMGDAGGCHPRDNIAMSWLAHELDLSHNIFDDQMITREDQTMWLAYMIEQEAFRTQQPIVILGKAYKAGINLTVGSCALLLANLLDSLEVQYQHFDPLVEPLGPEITPPPSVFFIATNHKEFKTWNYPKGSTIIDPWAYIPDKAGVKVIRIGRP